MRTEAPAETTEWRSLTTMTDTALVGVGIVMVQPYLGGGPLESIEVVSVTAFSGAIPLLSALLLLGLHENYRQRISNSMTVSLTRSTARIAALVGVATGIWRITPIAGVVFAGSSALGVLVYSTGYWWLERRQGALGGED